MLFVQSLISEVHVECLAFSDISRVGNAMNTLPPETKMGLVALTVSDLDRSLRFYINTLGFALIQREDRSALLGAGGEALLDLVELPGARPKPPRTTGLYHFAILAAFASRIWRVRCATWPRLAGPCKEQPIIW